MRTELSIDSPTLFQDRADEKEMQRQALYSSDESIAKHADSLRKSSENVFVGAPSFKNDWQ